MATLQQLIRLTTGIQSKLVSADSDVNDIPGSAAFIVEEFNKLKFLDKQVEDGLPEFDPQDPIDTFLEILEGFQSDNELELGLKSLQKTINFIKTNNLCGDSTGCPDNAVVIPSDRRFQVDDGAVVGDGQKELGFFIKNLPEVRNRSRRLVEQSLSGTMTMWQDVCGVDFIDVAESHAHLVIDAQPIDSQGNTLATASVGPPTSGQLQLVFDTSERWVRGPGESSLGKVFPVVALHELGHILGLSHRPGSGWPAEAVMHGSYGSSKETLTDDDIEAVRKIWGDP